MKKLAVILLLLTYGFTAIGATVRLHYCGNKFVSLTLQHNESDEQCDKCGMKKKGDCCTDKYQQVKLEDEHQKAAADQASQLLHTPILPPALPTFRFEAGRVFLLPPLSQAQHATAGSRIYILHAALLI
ncbi:MAG: HYC_CC_PP family protein [Agriterribacter sp.]